MSSSNTINKKCELCGKDYTSSFRTRNTSKFCSNKCRSNNRYKNKNEKLEDFVTCPICNIKFKEINTSHIKLHNLTINEWKEKYPHFDRLSKIARMNKSNLKNITTDEWKIKLKKSHTINGYINKYGKVVGKEKYETRCNNIKKSKSEEYFINKYGIDGYNKIKKNKGVTLDKYILKYGKVKGKDKYEKWLEMNKKKCTLLYYLEKYGDIKGYEKWFNKNKKISENHRSIDIDKIDDYKKYCIEVDKETRLSLQLNKLENIELRNNNYHLDHMVSKCYGFNKNIPAKIIGSIHNLKIITSNENLSKQKKCSLTLEELYSKL
jgi:hypothetical protein